jgi:hypothetical protein
MAASKAVPAVPVFEGVVNVSDSMKMSYAVNGTTSYGESYKLEFSSPEREAALADARATEDPGAAIPPALFVSVSFDTQDGGPTLLVQGKKYKVTITEEAAV